MSAFLALDAMASRGRLVVHLFKRSTASNRQPPVLRSNGFYPLAQKEGKSKQQNEGTAPAGLEPTTVLVD